MFALLSHLSFRITLDKSKRKTNNSKCFSNERSDIPTFKTATQRIVDIFLKNLFRSSEHRMMRIVYAPLHFHWNMANKFVFVKTKLINWCFFFDFSFFWFANHFSSYIFHAFQEGKNKKKTKNKLHFECIPKRMPIEMCTEHSTRTKQFPAYERKKNWIFLLSQFRFERMS